MDADDDEPPGSQLVPRPGPACVEAFEHTGVCVIPNFLGNGRAAALRRASLALFADGGMAPGALGGSDGRGIQRNFRGDFVAWLGPRGVNEPTKRCRAEGAVRATLRAGSKLLEDDHPFEVPSATLWTSLLGPLTTQLDMTVATLRPDLDRGEVMASVYPPDCGAQFRRHLDNPCDDGRRISAVYYVNPGWKREDGALLRCWSRHGEVEEILPSEDTLVLFEADSIEHEVTQNSSTGIFPDGYRCAFTCWYWEGRAPNVDTPRRRRSRSNRRQRKWRYLCIHHSCRDLFPYSFSFILSLSEFPSNWRVETILMHVKRSWRARISAYFCYFFFGHDFFQSHI
eukprot:s1483_g8.t2